jgi:hypothetical protein
MRIPEAKEVRNATAPTGPTIGNKPLATEDPVWSEAIETNNMKIELNIFTILSVFQFIATVNMAHKKLLKIQLF